MSYSKPSWARTVGDLLDHQIQVMAVCGICTTTRDPVDLAAIAAKFGRDFSLWDRRPPCRRSGCKGRVLFMYTTSPSTPFRPFKTHD